MKSHAKKVLFSTGLAMLLSLSCNDAPVRPENSKAKESPAYGDDASAGHEDEEVKELPEESKEPAEQQTAPDESKKLPNELLPNIVSVSVTNPAGEKPKKGDALKVTVKIENGGSQAGKVTINPILSSTRFVDFENLALSSIEATLEGGIAKELSFTIPVFLENTAKAQRFALGRGGYKLDVQLEYGGKTVPLAKPLEFEIEKGKGVFTLVMYDKRYFDKKGSKGADPKKWVEETMTRKSSVYDQKSKSKKIYPGGFDEMLDIRHIFMMLDTLDSTDDGSDVFDKPEALATSWLGMTKKWQHGSGPNISKHGYDYFIALDYDFWGGVKYGAAQVSGIGDETKDRMQVIMVHETGHVFGAPHCDPIQGYVMCSGEKHEDYKKSGEFVWLDDSWNAMRNIFLDY